MAITVYLLSKNSKKNTHCVCLFIAFKKEKTLYFINNKRQHQIKTIFLKSNIKIIWGMEVIPPIYKPPVYIKKRVDF